MLIYRVAIWQETDWAAVLRTWPNSRKLSWPSQGLSLWHNSASLWLYPGFLIPFQYLEFTRNTDCCGTLHGMAQRPPVPMLSFSFPLQRFLKGLGLDVALRKHIPLRKKEEREINCHRKDLDSSHRKKFEKKKYCWVKSWMFLPWKKEKWTKELGAVFLMAFWDILGVAHLNSSKRWLMSLCKVRFSPQALLGCGQSSART